MIIRQQKDGMLQKEVRIKQVTDTIKKLKADIEKLQKEASVFKQIKVIDDNKPELDKEKLRLEIKEHQSLINGEIANGKREMEKQVTKLEALKKRLRELTWSNKTNSHKILKAVRLAKSPRPKARVNESLKTETEEKKPERYERVRKYKRMKLRKRNNSKLAQDFVTVSLIT